MWQIREEIEQYGIKIYQFPDCDSDEDEDFKQQDLELKVRGRDYSLYLQYLVFINTHYYVQALSTLQQSTLNNLCYRLYTFHFTMF